MKLKILLCDCEIFQNILEDSFVFHPLIFQTVREKKTEVWQPQGMPHICERKQINKFAEFHCAVSGGGI
ncbi:MAG TPA: hypothetical protein DCM73_00255 [Clostridiales bacterium]|nr:hypothetical protein [Clostridiales bacterium]